MKQLRYLLDSNFIDYKNNYNVNDYLFKRDKYNKDELILIPMNKLPFVIGDVIHGKIKLTSLDPTGVEVNVTYHSKIEIFENNNIKIYD